MTPRDLLQFGRVDSDGTSLAHILSIDNQDTMPYEMWNYLHNFTGVEFAITVAQFTRMWKTLLFYRAQQIDEAFNHRRRNFRIMLDPNFLAPAPLVDALDSLGIFADKHSGITHYITPPEFEPKDRPLWTTVDANICSRWNWIMARFKRAFSIVPIPTIKDLDDRPLMMTNREETGNDTVIIRTLHQGPTSMDGIVRALHDEIFVAPPLLENCHIRMTPKIHTPTAILEYVDSYRLDYVP